MREREENVVNRSGIYASHSKRQARSRPDHIDHAASAGPVLIPTTARFIMLMSGIMLRFSKQHVECDHIVVAQKVSLIVCSNGIYVPIVPIVTWTSSSRSGVHRPRPESLPSQTFIRIVQQETRPVSYLTIPQARV